jgi:hypothetical protein
MDRFGEVLSVVLGALALAYLVYEIDRRKRKLGDLFMCSVARRPTFRPSWRDWSRAASCNRTPEGQGLDGSRVRGTAKET